VFRFWLFTPFSTPCSLWHLFASLLRLKACLPPVSIRAFGSLYSSFSDGFFSVKRVHERKGLILRPPTLFSCRLARSFRVVRQVVRLLPFYLLERPLPISFSFSTGYPPKLLRMFFFPEDTRSSLHLNPPFLGSFRRFSFLIDDP